MVPCQKEALQDIVSHWVLAKEFHDGLQIWRKNPFIGLQNLPNSGDSGCFCISWSTTAWHSTSSCVRKTRSSMLNLEEKGWICGSFSSLETLGCWCHVSHPSAFHIPSQRWCLLEQKHQSSSDLWIHKIKVTSNPWSLEDITKRNKIRRNCFIFLVYRTGISFGTQQKFNTLRRGKFSPPSPDQSYQPDWDDPTVEQWCLLWYGSRSTSPTA